MRLLTLLCMIDKLNVYILSLEMKIAPDLSLSANNIQPRPPPPLSYRLSHSRAMVAELVF